MIFNKGVTKSLAMEWQCERDWTRYVAAEFCTDGKCKFTNQKIKDKHGDNYHRDRFDAIKEFITVEMSHRDQIYGTNCLKEVSSKAMKRELLERDAKKFSGQTTPPRLGDRHTAAYTGCPFS